MTPPLDRLWKAPVRPGLSLSLVHCSLGEAQLWRGQAPFGREGLPTSAATPSALYLPPEQHAALPASAAVTAVTGYSSSSPLFFRRPICASRSRTRIVLVMSLHAPCCAVASPDPSRGRGGSGRFDDPLIRRVDD